MVEKLIEYLLYEFKHQIRNGVYGLTQRELSYNSNRIEGSTLTKRQTAFLFETGTLTSDGEIIRAKDIEEMTGHFAMLNEMLKTFHEPLTEDLIKRYHFQLKSGVFEDKLNGYPVGEYENRANIVGDIQTATPSEVKSKMKSLLISYHEKQTIDIVDLALFHAEYEKIHPFADGNGRTGRLILYKECLKNKIMPFIIHDSNKVEYYYALNQAQNEKNYKDLVLLFKKEQDQYHDEIKNFIEKENEDV